MATPPAVGWRLGVTAVLVLVAGAAVLRSCGTFDPLPPLPDYRDSLEAARTRYAADSAAWRVTVAGLARVADSALRVSRTAKAEAARLRSARRRDLIVLRADTTGFVEAPTMADTVVSLASYDSLAAEADSLWSVVRADSVAYAAQTARIRADSAAYASLASLRERETAIHAAAITTLQRDLARARRGCRVLFLPCPTISAGYGLTLSDGALRTGPTLSVSVPVRLK